MDEQNGMDINELTWLYGEPLSTGKLKMLAEDFIVEEDLGFEPDGEGEHLLVRIRKTGCNTQFVAEQLARFAGVHPRAVSYAGLKDRHAVTEQWFCLHLPGKDDPELSNFDLEGCQIVRFSRHRKKMRIGTLKGNSFTLVLRHLSNLADIDARLAKIAEKGVPNYFGVQRFGRNGNNLVQAKRWANNEIRVKERTKRSFYLSASRSAMFNLVASQRLAQGIVRQVMLGDALQLNGRGSWFVAKSDELESLQPRVDNGELLVTAPLPGDGALGTLDDAAAFEQACLSEQTELLSLVKRERVEPVRRAVMLQPLQMSWEAKDDITLELKFWLPAGSFATSVVRELMRDECTDVDVPEE